MTEASYSEIRINVRRAIRDNYGLLWDDSALDDLINEAQREYSILTGSLIGVYDVVTTQDGICAAPDNFIEPVKFIASDGFEKPFFSWKRLHDDYPDFRTVTGSAIQGLCMDFDDFGYFRTFPVLPPGINAGQLFYKRTPKLNTLETANTAAITAHCLFQAFLLLGNSAAQNYYNDFIRLCNAEQSVQRNLGNVSSYRSGRFF